MKVWLAPGCKLNKANCSRLVNRLRSRRDLLLFAATDSLRKIQKGRINFHLLKAQLLFLGYFYCGDFVLQILSCKTLNNVELLVCQLLNINLSVCVLRVFASLSLNIIVSACWLVFSWGGWQNILCSLIFNSNETGGAPQCETKSTAINTTSQPQRRDLFIYQS